jgi:hypothetical protein
MESMRPGPVLHHIELEKADVVEEPAEVEVFWDSSERPMPPPRSLA